MSTEEPSCNFKNLQLSNDKDNNTKSLNNQRAWCVVPTHLVYANTGQVWSMFDLIYYFLWYQYQTLTTNMYSGTRKRPPGQHRISVATF